MKQEIELIVGCQNRLKINSKWEILCASTKTKCTFEKGYLPNWTRGLFKISAVIKTQSPVSYKITDLDGESVRGTFYSQELQRVEKDQIYEIESILNHRKRKVGKKWVKEIKVHWKGYPSKFDSCIIESELV